LFKRINTHNFETKVDTQKTNTQDTSTKKVFGTASK